MKQLALLFVAITGFCVQAQEMCFTCTGTYYLRGHQATKEQTSDGHTVGLCIDKQSMAVTYDTEGSNQSKWRFSERKESSGTIYYYWRKEYDNGLYGRLSEQLELSDVKLSYQYVAKDNKDVRAAIAVNAKCTPVTRIGK